MTTTQARIDEIAGKFDSIGDEGREWLRRKLEELVFPGQEVAEAYRLMRQFGPGHRFDLEQSLDRLAQVEGKGLVPRARRFALWTAQQAETPLPSPDWVGIRQALDHVVAEHGVTGDTVRISVELDAPHPSSAATPEPFGKARVPTTVPGPRSNVSEWTATDALRFLLTPGPRIGETMGMLRAEELAHENPAEAADVIGYADFCLWALLGVLEGTEYEEHGAGALQQFRDRFPAGEKFNHERRRQMRDEWQREREVKLWEVLWAFVGHCGGRSPSGEKGQKTPDLVTKINAIVFGCPACEGSGRILGSFGESLHPCPHCQGKDAITYPAGVSARHLYTAGQVSKLSLVAGDLYALRILRLAIFEVESLCERESFHGNGDELCAICAAHVERLRKLWPLPVKPLAPRPKVLAIAELMEQKLRKHDGDFGDDGWLDADPLQLLNRLREESAELEEAVIEERKDMAEEAADVANLAMMVVDAAGGLGTMPKSLSPRPEVDDPWESKG